MTTEIEQQLEAEKRAHGETQLALDEAVAMKEAFGQKAHQLQGKLEDLTRAARALAECPHESPSVLVVVRERSSGRCEEELINCPKCGAIFFGSWLQPDLLAALRGALGPAA